MLKVVAFHLILLLMTATSLASSLQVGLSSNDITPPVGTPLGGYGGKDRRLKLFLDWGDRYRWATYLNPSHGILDPIRSKAMVVKTAQRAVVFVSIDAVGVTIDVHQVLKKRLAHLNLSEIFLSATHTHSGPGALSKSFVWQIIAMDKFEKEIYEAFVEGIAVSIEDAYKALEPAKLYSGSFNAPEIHRNRRDRPGYTDPEARLLLAKNANGQILGGLVNYAIHGCALGEENLLFSADIPGGIERHMEKVISERQNGKAPTMLFLNGAEGDISSSFYDINGIEEGGKLFAEKSKAALNDLSEVPAEIKYSQNVKTLAKGRINLKKCGVGKKEIKIGLPKKQATRIANVWQIKLGQINMMTFPGEPTTSIGLAAKEMARTHGYQKPWVLGLTNGHMGYFLMPEEYQEGGYESCVTLHGPEAGADLLRAHSELFAK